MRLTAHWLCQVSTTLLKLIGEMKVQKSISLDVFIVLSNSYRKQEKLTYPINTMRNVGRVPATSHYIFPSDLELYPSPGLIPQFLKMVSEGFSLFF